MKTSIEIIYRIFRKNHRDKMDFEFVVIISILVIFVTYSI